MIPGQPDEPEPNFFDFSDEGLQNHSAMSKRIPQLQPPDSMHLSAAEGWLGLGDILEANAELEQITAELRAHPDVLEVRWQIYAKQKQWDACVDITRTITKLVPSQSKGWIHLAYSTRMAKNGGLEAAVCILAPLVNDFPKNPLICYYLSCYTAQLDRLMESTRWWDKAMTIAGATGQLNKIRLMALDDPDLVPLLKGIGKA